MIEAAQRAIREIKTLNTMVRIGLKVRALDPNGSETVADVFESIADRYADRHAIVWRDEAITYRDLDTRSNRVAAWARSVGLGLGGGSLVYEGARTRR